MPPARRASIRRVFASASAAMLVSLAVAATTATTASADANTTAHISGPTSITVGTKAAIKFTVAGRLTTSNPLKTTIHWYLVGSSKACLLVSTGTMKGTSPGSFSKSAYLRPTSLTNDCAGNNVLEVTALDTSDAGGFDDTTTTVKILRAARWESFNAHPEPIHKGGVVHVNGTLQRANWDDGRYHRYTHRAAELQFRTITGSYATVKTVTSKTGDFHVAEAQQVSGCWRFVFTGSATTAPTTATGDCVTIAN